jgi:phosphodiesterase/alkaline phosphatase D-like protein
VVNQTGITTTSFTLTTALTASTPYFWKVLAVSTTSVTATGAPWAFTTGTTTPTNSVTLVSPANTSTGVSRTPTFSWSATGTPASYTLQVSTDSGFVTLAINQSGITSTSVTVTVTATMTLAAQTLYYWRVESLDSGSNILATSSPFTLTTGN